MVENSLANQDRLVGASVCRDVCKFSYEYVQDLLRYEGFNPHSQESQDGE